MVVPLTGAGDTKDVSEDPPTRWGYSLSGSWSSTPSSRALCVATGDFDGEKNDDFAAGMEGAVLVYMNNGNGQSFTGPTTLPLAGSYITQVETADYDGDGDVDIIALGQEYYYMADDLVNSQQGPTIGDLTVFYLENDGGAFTLEDSYVYDDAIHMHHWWYFHDGVFDMDVADIDTDGYVDTVVHYNRDTDGNAGNGGEGLQISAVIYDPAGLSGLDIYRHAFTSAYIWGQISVTEMDDSAGGEVLGYPDIVYTVGGERSGSVLETTLFIMWHSGSGSTYGNPVNLGQITRGGIFPSYPYALATGHFSGVSYKDIVVSVNSNFNNEYSDASLYLVRQLPRPDQGDRAFDDANSNEAYTQQWNYQIRGLAVGNLNNSATSVDDLIGFTKQDQSRDPSPYDGIEGWGITALRNYNPNTPSKFTELRKWESPDSLPATAVMAVALGNFDNDAEGLDDVVWVGDAIYARRSAYPADKPPELVITVQSPLPVRNNGAEVATINITVRDGDGAWDLRAFVADLRPVERGYVNYARPTGYDESDTSQAYYEFQLTVPETVPAGEYRINITMYDEGGAVVNDHFTLTVSQYNRHPVLSEGVSTNLTILEDHVTYFEDVYDWFYDADGALMNISMKRGTTWGTFQENEMFTARLVNGSDSHPEDWSLRISPEPNKYHKGSPSESKYVTFRAFDGVLYSEEIRFLVQILPVNDPPVIPPQGKPDDDFQYKLSQDDFGNTYIEASDAADGDESGVLLNYTFEYEEESDREWLTCTRDGKIEWFPRNEQVGPHMVTLWVDDGDANVSQVLWFNVTDENDQPYFVSISNGTTTIDLPRHIHERIVFHVWEHEVFNLTIRTYDDDADIGIQDGLSYRCNLTSRNMTFLSLDPRDPFKAYLEFTAEGKYEYFSTWEPTFPSTKTEVIITDQDEASLVNVLPLEIIIINVNDPPDLLTIYEPEEGQEFPILYHHSFTVGQSRDPDELYNDTLTYIWDFDASDGFQEDAVGHSVYWDFLRAGTYKVTCRAYDKSGVNYIAATVNITVNGERDEEDWDNDGLPNQWEIDNDLDPYDPTDADKDADGDKMKNIDEYRNETDPNNNDSDDDGVIDGEDYAPLDKFVSKPPDDKKEWYEEPLNIIIIIVVALIILLLILGLLGAYVYNNRRKAREEEEKRKQAEELQRSLYEDQDLYGDLPSIETTRPAMAPAPAAGPALPPQEGGLDDIFGGAGTLPSGQQPTLPPSQQIPAPQQAQLPPAPIQGAPPQQPQTGAPQQPMPQQQGAPQQQPQTGAPQQPMPQQQGAPPGAVPQGQQTARSDDLSELL